MHRPERISPAKGDLPFRVPAHQRMGPYTSGGARKISVLWKGVYVEKERRKRSSSFFKGGMAGGIMPEDTG